MVYIPRVRMEVYKAQRVGDQILYADDTAVPDYVIDDFIGLTIQFGTEKIKDKVSFQLINHREIDVDGTYTYSTPTDFDIDVKDLVKVYAWNDPMVGTLSENLILNGYIKSYTYNSDESIGTFQYGGFNRTEVLMNSFMFAVYNDGEQVPNMLVETLLRIRNYNRNDVIFAYKDYSGNTSPGTKGAYDFNSNPVSLDGGRLGYVRAYKKDAYKTDGSGELKDAYASSVPSEYIFSTKVYVETYKTMMKHLETLSNPEYTGDTNAGTYLYWVDNSGNLNWQPKSFTPVGTLIEKEFSSVKMSKDVDNVINAVIVNAGTDPNQNGILVLAINASSMGKNGAKWKYLAKTGIAEKFREKEAKSGDLWIDGELVVSTGDNSGNSINIDGYPTSYPWTVQHTGTNGDWTYTAHTTTVANDNSYLDYYRRICKLQGQAEGDRVVTYHSDPLWKGTWESDIGNNNFVQNQMVNIQVDSIGLSNLDLRYPLRIQTITHTFKTEWITTLQVAEDIDYRNVVG